VSGQAPSHLAPSGQAPSGQVLQIKLAKVILQANSTTVSVLDKKQLDTFRKRYTTQMGDPPQPDVEVTDTQLSAYACLLELGLPPAVDFGVWGPHGARLERDMYFKDQYLTPSGEWRSRELRGPDCLEAWESCYDVFKTAALMHGTAMAATLDTYAANFKRRVRKCHWCWHLALQADWRCRSECWVEERRRQEAFLRGVTPALDFQPFDAVELGHQSRGLGPELLARAAVRARHSL